MNQPEVCIFEQKAYSPAPILVILLVSRQYCKDIGKRLIELCCSPLKCVMIRLCLTGCLIAVLAATAVADQLVLDNGHTLTGRVSVEGDTVIIEMTHATLTFPKARVSKIVYQVTPDEELAHRLAKADKKDPKALFTIARWAEKKSLSRQVQDICKMIIRLDPDHAGARLKLGHVGIDDKWLKYDQAMELCRSKLAAGQHDVLLDEILPNIMEIATSTKRRLEVTNLVAHAQLRAGMFNKAIVTFNSLANKMRPPVSVRYAIIAEILEENEDGMYIVTEPYPPTASLLKKNDDEIEIIPEGPASLTRPVVLEIALRDKAKEEINLGKKHLAEAIKFEPTNPSDAKTKYDAALRNFDRADAIVVGIAKSWKVQIARRRITALRKIADASAKQFDEAMGKLGQEALLPQDYKSKVTKLLQHLTRVRDQLKKILDVAKPYPQELLLEIKWAELDLKKIDGMRKILQAELKEE